MGNRNIMIPVGLVKKIKPIDMPEKAEYRLCFFSLRYHFVKNKKLKVLNAVSEKSIK